MFAKEHYEPFDLYLRLFSTGSLVATPATIASEPPDASALLATAANAPTGNANLQRKSMDGNPSSYNIDVVPGVDGKSFWLTAVISCVAFSWYVLFGQEQKQNDDTMHLALSSKQYDHQEPSTECLLLPIRSHNHVSDAEHDSNLVLAPTHLRRIMEHEPTQ